MKNKFSICSSLLVLALTMLFSVSVQAQVFDPIDITGLVTAYKPADCGQSGSITIDGVTFTIAAGVDLTFIDAGGLTVDGSGALVSTIVRSEAYQVIGTGRRFRAYLESTGRIRMWVLVTSPVTLTSTNRTLTITGVVNATTANSITVNNVTFNAPGHGVTAGPNKVLITGTFNSNNELLGIVVNTKPYVTAQICACPFSESGGSLINPLVPDQPVANIINGGTVCDQAPGIVRYGFVNTNTAANFPIPAPGVIDQQVYGCLEFSFDQFGWVAGIKKLSPAALPTEIASDAAKIAAGEKIEVVCGKVANFTPATASATGSLRLGVTGNASFAFTIGTNQTLVNQAALIQGTNVCVFPAVEPAGPSAVLAIPGTQAPVRLFQLFGKTPVAQTTVVATPSVP